MRESPEYRGMFITTPDDFTVCSLEVALHLIESESFNRLEKMPVAEMNKQLDAIRARSQQPAAEALDVTRLSPGDRAAYEKIQRDNAPVFKERALISDLENLKGLAKLATMKFEADKKDAADRAATPARSGRRSPRWWSTIDASSISRPSSRSPTTIRAIGTSKCSGRRRASKAPPDRSYRTAPIREAERKRSD